MLRKFRVFQKNRICKFSFVKQYWGLKILSLIIPGILIVLYFNQALALSTQQIKICGDVVQIINPVISGYVASQERGLGHFAAIYGQSLGAMGGMKLVGKATKLEVSKRPSRNGGKKRYDGFPSGHTISAWAAAAYNRQFSENYKPLTIPLYAIAAVTGYSRIRSKHHTKAQVFGAITLAEAITYINSKMQWSSDYKASHISLLPDGFMFSLHFKF